MEQIEITDGARKLRFNGELIGSSTSWRPTSPRWVDYQLYRTKNGNYVVAKTAKSVVFHQESCSNVEKYGLQPGSYGEFAQKHGDTGIAPCPACHFQGVDIAQDADIYPEVEKCWGQSFGSVDSMIESLHQTDTHGVRYLTAVCRRLLNEAFANDPQVAEAYGVVEID